LYRFLNGPTEDDATYLVVVRPGVEERLNTTCFRGREVWRAGNFFRWFCAFRLFEDKTFTELLREALEDIVNATKDEYRHLFRRYLTVRCPWPVGWASTIRLAGLNDPRLKLCRPFNPNPHTVARRVPLEAARQGLLAPVTDLVTLAVEIRVEEDRRTGKLKDFWVVPVNTIYPGEAMPLARPHVGPPIDLTARHAVVFFDWQHPGDTSSIEAELNRLMPAAYPNSAVETAKVIPFPGHRQDGTRVV
jgi:hypothetical protein